MKGFAIALFVFGATGAAACDALVGLDSAEPSGVGGAGGSGASIESASASTSSKASSAKASSSSAEASNASAASSSSASSGGGGPCGSSAVCMPPPPSGWTYLGLAKETMICPAGTDANGTMETAPDPGTTCTCTCDAIGETTCNVRVELGNGSGCGTSETPNGFSDGGCDPIPDGPLPPSPAPPWHYGRFVGGPMMMPQCVDDSMLPPLVPSETDTTCTLSDAAPACGVGVCAPDLGKNSAWCITEGSAGSDPCPVGFATQKILYAKSDVVDERSCGGCACMNKGGMGMPCQNGTFITYADASCTMNPVQLADSCTALTQDPVGNAYFMFMPDASSDCSTGEPNPPVEGSVKLSNAVTVCCP